MLQHAHVLHMLCLAEANGNGFTSAARLPFERPSSVCLIQFLRSESRRQLRCIRRRNAFAHFAMFDMHCLEGIADHKVLSGFGC